LPSPGEFPVVGGTYTLKGGEEGLRGTKKRREIMISTGRVHGELVLQPACKEDRSQKTKKGGGESLDADEGTQNRSFRTRPL